MLFALQNSAIRTLHTYPANCLLPESPINSWKLVYSQGGVLIGPRGQIVIVYLKKMLFASPTGRITGVVIGFKERTTWCLKNTPLGGMHCPLFEIKCEFLLPFPPSLHQDEGLSESWLCR